MRWQIRIAVMLGVVLACLAASVGNGQMKGGAPSDEVPPAPKVPLPRLKYDAAKCFRGKPAIELGENVFEEKAPAGGVLVGVNVTDHAYFGGPIVPGRSIEVVATIQPIFQVEGKYVVGRQVGRDPQTAVKCLLAKPGYAVGAINARIGTAMDGLELVFMRIKGRQLDPSDSYKSEGMGNQRGGHACSVSAEDGLPVGLYGSVYRSSEPNNIGLVWVPASAVAIAGAGMAGSASPPAGKMGEPASGANDAPTAGVKAGRAFEDRAPDGAMMVGLHVSEGAFNGKPIIRSVQPVYDQHGKQVLGKRHGGPQGAEQQVVAKPGYAVGGINAKAGLLMYGFEVVFMRVDDNRLDPRDSYKSPWLGSRHGRNDISIQGNGRPIVGLHGACEADVHALGLILAP